MSSSSPNVACAATSARSLPIITGAERTSGCRRTRPSRGQFRDPKPDGSSRSPRWAACTIDTRVERPEGQSSVSPAPLNACLRERLTAPLRGASRDTEYEGYSAIHQRGHSPAMHIVPTTRPQSLMRQPIRPRPASASSFFENHYVPSERHATPAAPIVAHSLSCVVQCVDDRPSWHFRTASLWLLCFFANRSGRRNHIDSW